VRAFRVRRVNRFDLTDGNFKESAGKRLIYFSQTKIDRVNYLLCVIGSIFV